MDLINFKPGDVRGGGNIVSPSKTLTDFDVSDSVLTSVSDTVDGKTESVFNLAYRSGSYLTKSGDGFIMYTTSLQNMNVSVVLKKKNNTAISSASVSCTVNEDTVLTGTTNSRGGVTFSIPYTDGVSYYSLRFKYNGTNSVAGCSINGSLVVGNLDSICLIGAYPEVIEIGSTYNLISRVTGKDLDNNIIKVNGQRVSFLVYNPELFSNSVIFNDTTGSDSVTLNKDIGSEWCLKTSNFVTIGATSNNKIEIYRGALSVISEGTALVDGVTLTDKILTYTGGVLYYDNESVDLSATTIDTRTLVRHQGTVNLCYSPEGFITYNDGRATITRSFDGTTVTGTSNVAYNYWVDVDNDGVRVDLYSPLVIDFDVVSTNGIVRVYFVNNGTQGELDYLESYRNLSTLGLTGNNHVKIVFDGETIEYYVDDVLKFTDSFECKGNCAVAFRGYDGSSVTYKNFVVGGY